MSRPNPFVLTLVLLGFTVIFGGFSLMQGGLYLDTHEGDTYHHLDILYRMLDGQRPHIDFVTPLGILAFLPVTRLMEAGYSVGEAYLLAQIGVALWLLLPVIYTAATRLPRRTAYAFGLFVLGLAMAMTYGGAHAGVSISMHYNRWAWAVVFVVLALALLPPRGRSMPLVDGVLIGMAAMAILILKITFFVAFLVPVALALIWRGESRTLLIAIFAAAVAFGGVTYVLGADYWFAYFDDLRLVATSNVRPFVGVPFNDILAAPQFIGGTVVAILSGLLLRNAGYPKIGLVVILLVPAFAYVTYQNFGNDPKWLVFIAVLMMALRPLPGHHVTRGIDLCDGAAWLTVAAVALYLPSLVNLGLSPLNHAGIQSAKFLPMLPGTERKSDVFVRVDRANTMTAEIYMDQRSEVWARYSEDAARLEPVEIGGVTFEHCEFYAGSRAFMVEIAEDLESLEIAEGRQVFVADILSSLWLFGSTAPLEGAAPWYYGQLSGLENADYVLVPKCSFLSSHRRIIANDLAAADISLDVLHDRELYVLFRPKP